MLSKKLRVTFSFILCIAVVFTTTAIAFADGDDVNDGVLEDIEYTQEELDFISYASDDNDFVLRVMSVNASRSVPNPPSDVYGILSAVLVSINSQYAFEVHDTSSLATLNSILQNMQYNDNGNLLSIAVLLGSIRNSLGYTNAFNISDSLNAVAELLGYDFTNGTVPTNTLYDVCEYIEYMLASGLFNSNQVPYLQLIYQNTIDNYGSTIANRTYDMYRYMQDIIHGTDLYYIRQSLTNIDTNSSNIATNTSHIDSDLHEIKQWLNDTFYKTVENYIYYYNDVGGINYTVINPIRKSFTISSSPYYLRGFIVIDYDRLFLEDDYIVTYKFDKPVNLHVLSNTTRRYNLIDSNGYIIGGSNLLANTYSGTLFSYSYSNKILIINFNKDKLIDFCENNNISQDFTLDQTSESFSYSESFTITAEDSLIGGSEYINFIEHIDNDIHYQNDILDTFNKLYASDDLIQAKQAQQDFEDDAIESFTGDGANAPTLNDTGVLKNVGSSVKDGLTSGGGSASDALAIFDGDTGTFWYWFTNANYNAINTLYNPSQQNRGLLKSLNDTPSFIDDSLFSDSSGMGYYDINQHLSEVNYYD